MESFVIGERVLWLYTPRGGYGYTITVDAIVVKRYPSRLGIAARTHDGSWVPKRVSSEHLRKSL